MGFEGGHELKALTIILWLAGLLAAGGIWTYWRLEGSLLPKPSTRTFFRMSDMPLLKKLEGYLYAVRTKEYLGLGKYQGLFSKLGFSESSDSYHGKVLTRQDAAQLLLLNVPVDLPDLEHVIPYPVARSIILEQPLPSIAVMECPCRAQKEDSCPRDVCLVVGEPFVSFMLEHRPDKVRRINAEQALQILDEEEERGHIHTAWFKDAMHNRFYAICNCCTCCCLGMASYFRGVPRMCHSGYSPVISGDLCTECGVCAQVCPFQAMDPAAGIPAVEGDKCMGCGLCVSHCPSGAISLELVPDKGVPLDVRVLSGHLSA